MRCYTKQDLQHYEQLVAEARERIVASLDTLEAASSLLNESMAMLAFYEEERIRILEALSSSRPIWPSSR